MAAGQTTSFGAAPAAVPAPPRLLHSTIVANDHWQRYGLDVNNEYIVIAGTSYKDSEGYKTFPEGWVYDIASGIELSDVNGVSGRDFTNCAIASDGTIAVSLITGYPDIPFLVVAQADGTYRELITVNDQPLSYLVGFDQTNHMLVKSSRTDQLLRLNINGQVIGTIAINVLADATATHQRPLTKSPITWREKHAQTVAFTTARNAERLRLEQLYPGKDYFTLSQMMTPSSMPQIQSNYQPTVASNISYNLTLNPSRTILYMVLAGTIYRKNLLDDSPFVRYSSSVFIPRGYYMGDRGINVNDWCITDSGYIFSFEQDRSASIPAFDKYIHNDQDTYANNYSQYLLNLWQFDSTANDYRQLGAIRLPLGTPIAIKATVDNKLVILYHGRLEVYGI